MAARDDLQAQVDDRNSEIDSLQAQKARHLARIDYLNARIQVARDRKQAAIYALRDLPPDWTPAP